jgi:hypothetical protein
MFSVQKENVPFVTGENIGEAYLNSLDFIINKKRRPSYLIIHVSKPIITLPKKVYRNLLISRIGPQ